MSYLWRVVLCILMVSPSAFATLGHFPMSSGTSSVRNVFQFRANGYGTCFIDELQNLKCFGNNAQGTVGDGTTTNRTSPVTVLTRVSSVAAKTNSTCAHKTNGQVYCWGSNMYGELGNGTTTSSLSPTLASISNAVQIESTKNGPNYYILKANGEVYGWGAGRIGDGNPFGTSTPTKVSLPSNFFATKVYAGLNEACATGLFSGTSDFANRIYCWGGRFDVITNLPVAIDFSGPVLDMEGPYQGTVTVLVRESGVNKVYLYDDAFVTFTPVADFASYDVVSIFGDGSSHFALTKSGTLIAVGENTNCQLGDGTTTDRTSAITVPSVSGVVRVDLGDSNGTYAPTSYAWAQQADGVLKYWGRCDISGPSTPTAALVATYPVRRVEDSIATGHKHSCVVGRSGDVKCWGYNFLSALGDGTTTNRNTPVTSGAFNNVIQVKAGTWSTYALKADGTVSAWGYNWLGSLGDNTTTDRSTPVAVSGLSGVVALAAGTTSACALLYDGTVKCWGEGSNGRLGTGNTSNQYVPVAVSGLTDVVAIEGGGYHYCATHSGGRISCWGSNLYNQISSGSTTDILTPVSANFPKVSVPLGPYKARTLSTGMQSTCLVAENGIVRCRGDNQYGQLGNGTTTNSATGVTANTGVVDLINSRGTFACSIGNGGTTRCWGENLFSQLGDGTTTNRSTPVAVTNNYYTAIAAGNNDTMFRGFIQVGSLQYSVLGCGSNSTGEIGDGTFTLRSTPVATLY